MSGGDTERAELAALIGTWLQRSGLKQHVAAQKAGLSESQLYNSYKNLAPNRRINTDPDRALAVIRVFAERLHERDRCTAAEALRFLRLTRFPLDRYGEVERLFRAEHWQQALATPGHGVPAAATAAPMPSPAAASADGDKAVGRHNLPARLNQFIGRGAEQARIVELLAAGDASVRLLTLLGPAGVGKTRLVLEVAPKLLASFPDGVWFIDLAPVVDPALVALTVAAALGIAEELEHGGAGGLAAALDGRRLLLILDNCEHLIAACAQLAEELLRACPQLWIVATSREALRLAGERRFPVQPLALPDPQPSRSAPALSRDALERSEAVQLFVDRARLIRPDWQIADDQIAAVAQICAQLDGLPLALELAAARVAMFSIEQIAARLSDRFALLTKGQRTAAQRMQTLRASIDWSYSLLPAEEQGALRRLAVFKGGWSVEAAEEIAACSIDLLEELLQKSLVVAVAEQDAMRYTLLETIQQYAYEKLRAAGELAAAQARHFAFYLDLAETAEPELVGAAQAAWLDRLEGEYDNLRSALNWAGEQAEPEAELRLAGALARFWQVRGYWREGRERLDHAAARIAAMRDLRTRALASATPAAPPSAHLARQLSAWAKVLGGAGWFAYRQGDYAQSQQHYAESGSYYAELGDLAGAAGAYFGLGDVVWIQGQYPAARDYYAESLRLYRQAGQPLGIAEALRSLGRVQRAVGEYAAARTLVEESLTRYRALSDLSGAAKALSLLGSIVYTLGDYAEARARYEESLALRRELDDRAGLPYSLNLVGLMALAQHDIAAAERYCREALTLARELGDLSGAAMALNNLGEIARAQAAYQTAAACYTESLTIYQQLGLKLNIVTVLHNLGYIWLQLGACDRALLHFQQGLQLAHALGDQLWIVLSLSGVAATFGRQGAALQACALFGAAEAMLSTSGLMRTSPEADEYPGHLAAVREQLDPATFAQVWAAGYALSAEQVLALATQGPAGLLPAPDALARRALAETGSRSG